MNESWPVGPFTAAELGLSTAAVRCAVRQGAVRPVVRGVYAAAHLADTIELRARAVAKAARPHHVVTDRTAAWLHDIDTHVYAEHDDVPLIETCALRGRQPTTLDGVDGRTRDLQPEDIMELHGVLVTTPLRTALDLGCVLRRREAFAALCAFAHRYGLSRQDYERVLRRFRRRRGVVQLRELVALVDPRIESQREAWVLLAIVDAGVAMPEPQFWIAIDGVPTYRLDFAYPRRRVCVEYDGGQAHEGQEAYDEARRQWLRDHGWTVIVVREGDFTGSGLRSWMDELRVALVPSYTNRRW
jgi:hypothetical protein